MSQAGSGGDQGLVAAEKAALRARLQEWRAGLTQGQVRAWSALLSRHLLAWPLPAGAPTVLLYAALRREPQTLDIAVGFAARGAVLVLPLVAGLDLVPRLLQDPPGGPGPLLPGGVSLDPQEVDVILVPGLAFDRAGRRLGRGGGHYDRFLPRLRPDCVRVGMCFSGQLVPLVPVAPWDQTVDVVATEAGVWEGVERRAGRG